MTSTETLDLWAVQERTSVSAMQGQGGSSARSPPVDALQGRSASARLLLRPGCGSTCGRCWRAARIARHVVKDAVRGVAVLQAFRVVVIHAVPRVRALAVAVAAVHQAPPALDACCGARATGRFASSIECNARRERVVQLFAPQQAHGVAGLRLALQNQRARRKHQCSAELRNKTCTQRSVLRCTAQRPALWAPYRIPPMDFRFYSIPSRSSAQQ